ncbi:MAG: Gfo/Idh/MocA family oxidoreductase [Actinomycetia bacterium]|nr:Gfo/Idh/MocA family oxidoreductase [Actinomycetes bacterium]
MNHLAPSQDPLNFALIGVAGYIAPRDLEAIRQTGNRLVAATDPSDSVGILDRYGFDISYFREIERFDRFLYRSHRGEEDHHVDYVSICTPNYLHDTHIRLALRNGCHAICEKPLVINPWNLDALAALEKETGCTVSTILQLRVHPQLVALKERLDRERQKAEGDSGGGGPLDTALGNGPRGAPRAEERTHQVDLTYVTSRGRWYDYSWKGQEELSGGVSVNIGVHFFDLLLWLFGPAREVHVHLRERRRMAGTMRLERARVRWFLSVGYEDLPLSARDQGLTTYRSLTMDAEEVEFSGGFTDLHTEVYRRTLAGQGFGLDDARPAIELTYQIRTVPVEPGPEEPVGFVPQRETGQA